MRQKHRNIGDDSPFHPNNAPPDQYLIPEKILDKPCKLSIDASDVKKIPYSGKVGVLGYRILESHRKAQHVTSIDLDERKYGFLSP